MLLVRIVRVYYIVVVVVVWVRREGEDWMVVWSLLDSIDIRFYGAKMMNGR